MKLGLLSDTHGYFDPRLAEMFRGVDKILHAGDAGSQEVLDRLAAIAPLTAVAGNVDSPDLRLALSVTLQLEGMQLEMMHILPVAQSRLEALVRAEGAEGAGGEARLGRKGLKGLGERERLAQTFQTATRAVIFGHTHKPCAVRAASKVFVNPGSAGRKRLSLPRCCAVMKISGGAVEIKFLPLEDYNQNIPEAMRMTLGGSALC